MKIDEDLKEHANWLFERSVMKDDETLRDSHVKLFANALQQVRNNSWDSLREGYLNIKNELETERRLVDELVEALKDIEGILAGPFLSPLETPLAHKYTKEALESVKKARGE